LGRRAGGGGAAGRLDGRRVWGGRLSRFVLREGDSISTGRGYSDVERSEPGPEVLPAVVCDRLRDEVHRSMTKEGAHGRALVELLRHAVA
jgi:hypothetical protein